MDSSISQLPTLATIKADAQIPVSQDDTTKKISAAQLIRQMSSNIDFTTLKWHTETSYGNNLPSSIPATDANWATYNVTQNGTYRVRFQICANAGNGAKTLYNSIWLDLNKEIESAQTSNNSYEQLIVETIVWARAGQTITAKYRSVPAGSTSFSYWNFIVEQIDKRTSKS